MNYFSNLFLE